MAKGLTDIQVEQEIERLRESEYVKLARKDERIRYQRRQVLYNLRALEKRGIALAEAGITMEMLSGVEGDEDNE